jgi:hypothetical protein
MGGTVDAGRRLAQSGSRLHGGGESVFVVLADRAVAAADHWGGE